MRDELWRTDNCSGIKMSEKNISSNGKSNKFNILRYPLTFCVGIIIIANLIGYIFGEETDFSDMENRFLTKRPQVSFDALKDGSFMETFETYAAEQIPLRDALVKGKSAMEMLLGKCENNTIAKGEEDYLFDKCLKMDEQAHKNAAIIADFIKNCDRRVVVAIAPTSTAIYEEYLPKGMPVLDEEALFTDIKSGLEGVKNAEVVDLFRILSEKKSEGLYYKTDHHWNTKGAYYAYEAICEALDASDVGNDAGNDAVGDDAVDGAEVETETETEAEAVPVDITALTKHEAHDFYGTFNAKYKGIGIAADTIEYYDIPIESYEADGELHASLYDMSKLEIYDKYAMFMYGNPGRGTIKASNVKNGRSLIVFKDSYANCLIPFLAMNYDTIEIVDLRYSAEAVSDILDAVPDADILMLYNCSFINEDKHFYKLL